MAKRKQNQTEVMGGKTRTKREFIKSIYRERDVFLLLLCDALSHQILKQISLIAIKQLQQKNSQECETIFSSFLSLSTISNNSIGQALNEEEQAVKSPRN